MSVVIDASVALKWVLDEPLKSKEREPVEKETKVSRRDPDSGYMVRDGMPKGFFYLDLRTADGRHSIITDTFATPANVLDSIVYLGRLDRQRDRFGFDVKAVGDLTPVTPQPVSLRAWKIATSLASRVIAILRRPSRACCAKANMFMRRIKMDTSVRRANY